MRIINQKHAFPDMLMRRIIRDGHLPVLSLLKNERYEELKTIGASVRFVEPASRYTYFSLANGQDLEPLARDITDGARTFTLFDGRFKAEASRLFPAAKLAEFIPVIATPDTMPAKAPPHKEFELQTLDMSWLDLITENYTSNEFTKDYFAHQIKNDLALGAVRDTKRIGFMLGHKNTEAGPLWIDPDCRAEGIGSALIWHWNRLRFKRDAMIFGMISTGNAASIRTLTKAGYTQIECTALIGYILDENGNCYQP